MNVFIILNYNDFETTINFLKMIKDYSSISKIVVVDNNSTDGSYEKISRYKSNKIFIIKSDKNGGYGYGNNFGIKFARKKWNSIDFFTITNPDIIVSEQTIFSLNCIFNTHQELGIIAPVIRNVDNSIVSNFIWEVPSYKAMITETSLIGHKICKMINKSIYHNFNELKKNNLIFGGCVPGCFFMIKNDTFSETLFDEDCFLYGEETILGYKMKSINKKVAVASNLSVIHLNHVSIIKNKHSWKKEQKYMLNSFKIYLSKYLKISNIKMKIYCLFYFLGKYEKRLIGYILNKI